jgi:lincosamide nucleotidyltransferase A/C/D/E
MMTAADILRVIRALEDRDITVWRSDGGWGVDALLGEQTRPRPASPEPGWSTGSWSAA